MINSLKSFFRVSKIPNAADFNASFPCQVGDNILLYSKPGKYQVVSVTEDSFIVTCRRWQRTKKKEFRTQKHLWSDFKRKVD